MPTKKSKTPQPRAARSIASPEVQVNDNSSFCQPLSDPNSIVAEAAPEAAPEAVTIAGWATNPHASRAIRRVAKVLNVAERIIAGVSVSITLELDAGADPRSTIRYPGDARRRRRMLVTIPRALLDRLAHLGALPPPTAGSNVSGAARVALEGFARKSRGPK